MYATSFVMDHERWKWERNYPGIQEPTWVRPINLEPAITDDEIREFRDLLERARKYDAENDEPECELDEKKATLLDMAEKLGVEIDFL